MKVLISTGLCIVYLTLLSFQTKAQNSSVAIGDATPKTSAVLYLKSPGGNQGLIIPIVTSVSSIVTPEAGMIVYNTTDDIVYYYNGTIWGPIGSVSGGGTDSQDLSLNSTTNVLTLTNDATNVDLSAYKQTLSITGNSLSISGGNAVILPTSGAGVTSVTAGTGLTGGVITTTGTINVDVGTTAGKIVQLDGTGRLPAIDGSQLTNLAGGGDITGVSAGTGLTGGATSGNATLNVNVGTGATQIVQLDATGRLPAVDGSQLTNLAGGGDITGVTAGTGLTGGAASGNATLNVNVGTGATQIVQLDATGKLPAVDGSQLTNLAGGGDITGVTAGTGLTGGAASGNATLNVNVGTGATQIVQLDATGRLPSVDGSQLTNLPTGSGSVTNVSVITANGVSGTVANQTTTPAITLTLGTITPTSVSASGTVIGSNLSGTNTGDQTSVSGNAGTATALQTGRTISMTGDVTYSSPAFNGTSNVTAAATVARINGNTVPANASGALTNNGSGTLTWTPTGSGTVTTVSGTLPISVATPTTTPVISISQANGTTNGYLSSTDWSTFNSKGSGTVTSVGLTMPSIFTVASSPVTAAGTIGVTYSGTALPVANGGTGRVTWDGLLVGAGAAINDISNGNPNEVLTMVGTSPSWQLPAASGWSLTGNAGTTPATNFLGTTDAQDVAFRANNLEVMRITPAGDIGVGITAPTSRLHLHNPLVQGNFMKITHLNAPSGITIGNSGTAGREAFIANNENAAMYFQTNALNRMAIDASGRVLINTVTGQSNAILDIVPTGAGIGNIVLRGSSVSPNDPVDIEFRNFTASTVLGKIYMNPSASDMLFEANGATRLTLQNDGNVGIGTTSPSAKLDVIGAIKITDGTQALNRVLTSDANGLASWQPAGAGTGWTLTGNAGTTVGTNFVGTTDNVGLSFKTNNLERIRILNGGNVGIGITAPTQKLDVVGNMNISASSSYMIAGTNILNNNAAGNSIFAGGNNLTTAANSVSIGTGAGAVSTATDNTFVGRNAGLVNVAGTLNTMVGSGSGQFTTSGSRNVFVGYRAGFTNATGIRNVIIGNEADVNTAGLTNAIAIGYQAIAGASNTMALGGTGANAVSVGIGTSTPHAQLQLATSVANRKIILYESANNDHEFIGFGVDPSGALRYQTAVNVNDHIFYTAANATTSNELMRIKGTGLVGIGRNPTTNQLEISGNASKAVAGGWLANSDRRIKTDVRDIDNSLELIMKVRPVKYKYTAEWMRRNPSIKDQYYYSFIAQEYQQVFPEAVQGSGEYLEGDKTEILQIDTYNAQIVTIKAVQEQQKIIETQQNEIDNLKKELAEIKNYLNMEAKVVKKKKGRK